MGKIIVSWSPIQGKSGVTTNTAVLATLAAITKPYASLLINASNNPNVLERYVKESKSTDAIFSEGIAGLKRLLNSNLLSPDAVPDYAENIIYKKLDIILGSSLDEGQLIKLLQNAVNAYEFVWVDLKNGDNQTAEFLLDQADLVLVHLPQSLYDIETLLPEIKKRSGLTEKTFYIVGNYDANASLSIKNIKRLLKIKDSFYSISYSSTLKNAINSNSISEYLIKVPKQGPFTNNTKFVQGAINIIDDMLQCLSNDRKDW